MDSTVDLFIRERLSRLGREIGWFDMPVHAKIEALQKEIQEKAENDNLRMSTRDSEDSKDSKEEIAFDEENYESDGYNVVESGVNSSANDNGSDGVVNLIASDVDENSIGDDSDDDDFDINGGVNDDSDSDNGKEEGIQNGTNSTSDDSSNVGDPVENDDSPNNFDIDASPEAHDSNIGASIGDHDININDRESESNGDNFAMHNYSEHSSLEDSFSCSKKGRDENRLDYKDNGHYTVANVTGDHVIIGDSSDDNEINRDDGGSVDKDDLSSVNSDSDDAGNNDKDTNYSDVWEDVLEPGSKLRSLDKDEETDNGPNNSIQLPDKVSNCDKQVTEGEDEKDNCNKFNSRDWKIWHSTEGNEEDPTKEVLTSEASKASVSAEIDDMPEFVGWHSIDENYGIESEGQDQVDQDKSIDRIDNINGLDESCAADNADDVEEKRHEELVESGDLETDKDGNATKSSKSMSWMTDCHTDDSISDSPALPSLQDMVLKKNKVIPGKISDGEEDDFESFLEKIKTPKTILSYSGTEEKREAERLEAFIVSDDDDVHDNDDYDDLEEDVFMDPGFTPDEYYSDKENDDCQEKITSVSEFHTPLLTTPTVWHREEESSSRKDTVTSRTPFKTPSTNFLSQTSTLKATKLGSYKDLTSHPKSVLDRLLASYSSEKDFKKIRDRLATDLFELYNRTVFDNQLPSDFQITWNNKMRSTAGFCYYSRKNGMRLSRIELADKVIDSAERLRDTLIHEMCHAATWIIDGIKAGHGSVWKRWTMRAQIVHQDLPPISRCHSFAINTKYTYRCTKCGNSFGRHSKSVNLEKSRCARCYGCLELIPQLKKDGTPQTRTPSRFALFVKDNFARVKKDNASLSHQEVMKTLGSEFAKLSS
ncbi:germ cell nuclear acidic protein-like [Montipora capricornis]|uniref:germ cell nuclear acidic protein-like n=1 Tax=Montipora capricornis TaxID=246305 RepID=UPI0035F1FE9A